MLPARHDDDDSSMFLLLLNQNFTGLAGFVVARKRKFKLN